MNVGLSLIILITLKKILKSIIHYYFRGLQHLNLKAYLTAILCFAY